MPSIPVENKLLLFLTHTCSTWCRLTLRHSQALVRVFFVAVSFLALILIITPFSVSAESEISYSISGVENSKLKENIRIHLNNPY